MGRAPCCEKVGLNRGAWTREEDMKLIQYITTHGEGNWRTLPKAAGLLRCGKSCRLRWINYLRPDLKRGNITEEEDRLIIKLHSILGNRWSLIAGRLPGRTDNEIKNYWNTHLKKKLKSMGIDPNTHQPLSHIEGSTSCSANTNTSVSEVVESHHNTNFNMDQNHPKSSTPPNKKNNLHTLVVHDYMDAAAAGAPGTPPTYPDISAAAPAANLLSSSTTASAYNHHYYGIPRTYFPASSPPSPPRDFKAKPIFFFDPRVTYAQSPQPHAGPIFTQHVAPIHESPIACSSTSSSSSSLPHSSSVSDQGEIVFPAIANNNTTTTDAQNQTPSPIAARHVDVDPNGYNLNISISRNDHHYHTPNNNPRSHAYNYTPSSHSMGHHPDLEVDFMDDHHHHYRTPISIGISSHPEDDHRTTTPSSIISHLSHLSHNSSVTTPMVSSSVVGLFDTDLMWDFDMGMHPLDENVPTPGSHDVLHNLWGPPSSTTSSSWQLHDHHDSKIV